MIKGKNQKKDKWIIIIFHFIIQSGFINIQPPVYLTHNFADVNVIIVGYCLASHV